MKVFVKLAAMATEIDISQLPTKKKEARIVMMKAKILHELDFTMDLILESYSLVHFLSSKIPS